MSTQTENIGLTQPSGSEKYSLDINNENLAKIDSALGELQESVGSGTGGGLGDKVGNYDDTESGTVFGDLNIIKEQTEQGSKDIASVKILVNNNATKLTTLQTTANNTKTVVDIINTNTGTIKQNTETLKTSIDSVSTMIENINSNASSNNSKLDIIANKADVINGQVQTINNNVNVVKTDIASVQSSVNTTNTNIANVQSSVNTANSNIASIKNTVESTSGKADTTIELLNLLKTIATTKTKPVACSKTGSKSSDFVTDISITGSGTLDKAIAFSSTAGGQIRITVDDEIVLNATFTAQKFVGAMEDVFSQSTSAVFALLNTGTATLSWKSISTDEWIIGYSGSSAKSATCVCLIPNGIKFYKNFKLETKSLNSGGVTVTGEVEETAIVSM